MIRATTDGAVQVSESFWLDVWGPLLAFALACGVWHWVFIYVHGLRWLGMRPLNALRWKQLDYIALAITGLSLLFVVGDSRRVFADHEWRLNFASLSSAQAGLSDAMSRFTSLVCGRAPKRSEYSPPNFDDLVKQEMFECDQSNKLRVQVGLILQSQDRAHLYSFEPPSNVTDGVLRDDYRSLVAAHKLLIEAEARNGELYGRAQRGLVLEWLRVLSIYVLAVALAFRIAKNTADIRSQKTAD
jgi:hypothetical protein